MKKITKSDLIRLATQAVSPELTVNQENVKIVVNAFLGVINKALNDDTRVFIRDFGSFTPKDRPAHEGFDVRLKKKVHKPQKKVVKFKVSETLLKQSKEVESK